MTDKQKKLNESREHFKVATGKVIENKRKKKNITQKALGDALCVSEATVSRYEKGKIDIPASSLPIISGVCDFPMKDYLLGWKGISLESMIREALKAKTDNPDEEMVEYIAHNCTDKEADEILNLGLAVDYIVDASFKNQILTVMIEHHISHKQDEATKKRIYEYYRGLTKEDLSFELLGNAKYYVDIKNRIK